jgi:hypothetical protein
MNLPTARVRAVFSASSITSPESIAMRPSLTAEIAEYRSYHGLSLTSLRALDGLLFHAERGSADSSSWPKSAKPEVTSWAIVESAHAG